MLRCSWSAAAFKARLKEGVTLKLRLLLLMLLKFMMQRNCLCNPGSIVHIACICPPCATAFFIVIKRFQVTAEELREDERMVRSV